MKSREERLLRKLRAETAKSGYNVVLVKQDMMAPVSAFIWKRKVEQYRSKWESDTQRTPLQDWQDFMLKKVPPRPPKTKRPLWWRRVLPMPYSR